MLTFLHIIPHTSHFWYNRTLKVQKGFLLNRSLLIDFEFDMNIKSVLVIFVIVAAVVLGMASTVAIGVFRIILARTSNNQLLLLLFITYVFPLFGKKSIEPIIEVFN
jgi:hypothetical protein